MTFQQIIFEELETLKAEVIARTDNAGQTATGITKATFATKATETLGQLLGASYAGVLERGRKPGGVPKDFVDILKRWAQAKGLSFSDEKQFNLWANAVKWKIIKEGTKLYRSGQYEDIFTTPIENFDRRITKRFAVLFDEEITIKIFEK